MSGGWSPDRETFPDYWTITPRRDLVHILGLHETWRRDAACRDADPKLFDAAGPREYGGQHSLGYPVRAREAAAYCRRCPVIAPCGVFADELNTEGFWAGMWRRRRSAGSRVTDKIPVPPIDEVA